MACDKIDSDKIATLSFRQRRKRKMVSYQEQTEHCALVCSIHGIPSRASFAGSR